MDAVIFRQSKQLQTKVSMRPGPEVGWEVSGERSLSRIRSRLTNASCTVPQKHVAVASSSVDQPSLVLPARGKYDFDLSAVDMVVYFVFLPKVLQTVSKM